MSICFLVSPVTRNACSGRAAIESAISRVADHTGARVSAWLVVETRMSSIEAPEPHRSWNEIDRSRVGR